MKLDQPYWLLIALLGPLLHRFWQRRNRPAALRFSWKVPSTARSWDPLTPRLFLRYLALAALAFALARPQEDYRQQARTVEGIDIMMVMDVSASMNIEDLSDRARIDVAKETMRNFVKARSSDRIGFVIFSGEPFTLVPPTLDYAVVVDRIRDAQIGVLKDGTAIGDGLALAVHRLKESRAKSRIIILLTDGDNNVGQLDPGDAGELAAGLGIRTYTIAIGREGRVKLPIRQKTPLGRDVVTYQWFDNALNPALLEKIARITNGKFYRVTDAEALTQVFTEIDQLERTEIKSNERVRYDERFQRWIVWAFFLLLLERFLSLTLWRVATG